jgi:hypothetical protein
MLFLFRLTRSFSRSVRLGNGACCLRSARVRPNELVSGTSRANHLIDRWYCVRLISARLATGPSVLTGGRLFFPRTIVFPTVEKVCKMVACGWYPNITKQSPAVLSWRFANGYQPSTAGGFCISMEVGSARKGLRNGTN